MIAIILTGGVNLPFVVLRGGIGVIFEIVVGNGIIIISALLDSECRRHHRRQACCGQHIVSRRIFIFAGDNALSLCNIGAVHFLLGVAAMVGPHPAVVGQYNKQGILKITEVCEGVIHRSHIFVDIFKSFIILVTLISAGMALVLHAVKLKEGKYRIVFGPVFYGHVCNFIIA